MKAFVTLNQNRDFKRIYYRGKSMAHAVLVVYVQKNRLHIKRIGITASKKIGNAVERNRARRIIKAAFTDIVSELPDGWDYVFVARRRTVFAKSTDLIPVMRKLLPALLNGSPKPQGRTPPKS